MKTVEKEFVWQTSKHNGGEAVPVSKMGSRHLFYAWLMIWNHSAPPALRVWDNHRYVFSSFYTAEYMLKAFRAMYIELKYREDLTPGMLEVIEKIESNYAKTIFCIEAPNREESSKKREGREE